MLTCFILTTFKNSSNPHTGGQSTEKSSSKQLVFAFSKASCSVRNGDLRKGISLFGKKKRMKKKLTAEKFSPERMERRHAKFAQHPEGTTCVGERVAGNQIPKTVGNFRTDPPRSPVGSVFTDSAHHIA